MLEVDEYLFGGFDTMVNTPLTDAILEFTTIVTFYKMVLKLFDGTASAGFDVEMKYPYLGVPLGEHKDILY